MELVATLAAHRERLLSAYKGHDWHVVAAQYGASESSREEALRTALDAVVAWARRLTSDVDVLAHLDSFTDEAVKEAAPKTGATAGLSMIFANATANTGWWADKFSSHTTYIATCMGCGAPQMRVLHFQCDYCDQPLYPEKA